MKTSYRLGVAVAAVAGLALAGLARADTIITLGNTATGSVTATPVDDTYISGGAGQGAAQQNYGTLTTMTAGGTDLIGFEDLSAYVPAGSTITSATLTLYTANYASATSPTVYQVTTNWLIGAAGTNQTTVTAQYADGIAHPWAIGSPPSSAIFSSGDYTTANDYKVTAYTGNPPLTVNFNVTGIVQSWATNGDNYGFAILGGNTFYASESGATDQPTLTIDFTPPSPVPEPASLGLLGLGGLMLLVRRRRA